MWAGGALELSRRSGSAIHVTRISTIARRHAQGRPQRRTLVRRRPPRISDRPRGTRSASGRISSTARRRSPAKSLQPHSRPSAPRQASRSWTVAGGDAVDAAVPLFGDHLQRPPHPLRPSLCDRRVRAMPGLVVHGPMQATLLLNSPPASPAVAQFRLSRRCPGFSAGPP
jgi:hydroxyacyl-ACP dehydratase HTD2-like protein with hotdog domain